MNIKNWIVAAVLAFFSFLFGGDIIMQLYFSYLPAQGFFKILLFLVIFLIIGIVLEKVKVFGEH